MNVTKCKYKNKTFFNKASGKKVIQSERSLFVMLCVRLIGWEDNLSHFQQLVGICQVTGWVVLVCTTEKVASEHIHIGLFFTQASTIQHIYFQIHCLPGTILKRWVCPPADRMKAICVCERDFFPTEEWYWEWAIGQGIQIKAVKCIRIWKSKRCNSSWRGPSQNKGSVSRRHRKCVDFHNTSSSLKTCKRSFKMTDCYLLNW